ncbi:hypothetical protein [Nostoc sp.]|uniref:hypothetical protein n=1 Tax=Nostoc sp. TaxID=1180 RepID=UPI002FFB365A
MERLRQQAAVVERSDALSLSKCRNSVHRWGLGRQEGQGRQGRMIQEVSMLPIPNA